MCQFDVFFDDFVFVGMMLGMYFFDDFIVGQIIDIYEMMFVM